MSVLASEYRVNKQFAESDRLYRKALAIYRKLYGKNDPKVADYLERVGYYHYEQKEYDHAEPYYKEALRLWERIYKPDSLELCPHLVKQGRLYQAWGKSDKAEAFYQQEMAIKEKDFGKDASASIPSTMRRRTFLRPSAITGAYLPCRRSRAERGLLNGTNA